MAHAYTQVYWFSVTIYTDLISVKSTFTQAWPWTEHVQLTQRDQSEDLAKDGWDKIKWWVYSTLSMPSTNLEMLSTIFQSKQGCSMIVKVYLSYIQTQFSNEKHFLTETTTLCAFLLIHSI